MLLVVIVVLMAILGAGIYGEVRRAVGLPYRIKGKPFPEEPAKSDEEIFAILARINPTLLTVIGYGASQSYMQVAKNGNEKDSRRSWGSLIGLILLAAVIRNRLCSDEQDLRLPAFGYRCPDG